MQCVSTRCSTSENQASFYIRSKPQVSKVGKIVAYFCLIAIPQLNWDVTKMRNRLESGLANGLSQFLWNASFITVLLLFKQHINYCSAALTAAIFIASNHQHNIIETSVETPRYYALRLKLVLSLSDSVKISTSSLPSLSSSLLSSLITITSRFAITR